MIEESPFGFCHRVFKELRKASRVFQDYMNPVFNEVGLKPLEGCLLAELDRKNGQTINELACNTSIIQSNLPPLWHSLEDKGLIERRKDDVDARSYRLYLTEEGARVVGELDALVSSRLDGDEKGLMERRQEIVEGFAALALLFGGADSSDEGLPKKRGDWR